MIFRTGLLYSPTRRSHKQRTSFVYIPHTCDFASLKSSASKRAIWIARLHSVREAVAKGYYDEIANMGHANYVTSVGSMGHAMRLQSLVTELCDHRGDTHVLDADGEQVLLVVTRDLHGYAFIYDSLRTVHDRLRHGVAEPAAAMLPLPTAFRDSLFEADCPLLRTWLGLALPQNASHQFLARTFDFGSTFSQRLWQRVDEEAGFPITPAQKEIFASLDGNCAWIDSFAGNGQHLC